MTSPELRGRVAIVTGGSGGIGSAVAHALASSGARLALFDRTPVALERVVAQLRAHGGDVTGYPVDLRLSADVNAAVTRVEEELGPVELLANVAGVLRMGSVSALSDQDWDETFAVNATGLFYVCRAVAKLMSIRNSGSIVTVSSNAARVPRSQMAAYGASKAAASALTLSLGLDLARFGVRCNVVAPGSTDTSMLRSMGNGNFDPAHSVLGDPSQFRGGIPLGRIAEPEDIAQAVLFLLSDRSRHITLSTMLVDGGAALGA
jgi:2,3-dihydro-2,3-dihydroxybenzoate dehydrogenase